MGSFGADTTLHRPTPPGHISSQRHSTRKYGARIKINVAGHQEKGMNEKTGKKEVGEEGKHSIDFKVAACCPSVVQRAAWQKMVCVRGE